MDLDGKRLVFNGLVEKECLIIRGGVFILEKSFKEICLSLRSKN